MDIALIALLTALGKKFMDTFRAAESHDWKTVRTQVLAWGSGVGLIFLGAESDWAAGVQINDIALADINGASKVLAGMSLLSVAGMVHDLTKSVGSNKEAPIVNVINRPQRPLVADEPEG